MSLMKLGKKFWKLGGTLIISYMRLGALGGFMDITINLYLVTMEKLNIDVLE